MMCNTISAIWSAVAIIITTPACDLSHWATSWTTTPRTPCVLWPATVTSSLLLIRLRELLTVSLILFCSHPVDLLQLCRTNLLLPRNPVVASQLNKVINSESNSRIQPLVCCEGFETLEIEVQEPLLDRKSTRLNSSH